MRKILFVLIPATAVFFTSCGGGFQKTKSGLEYQFLADSSTPLVKDSDIVYFNVIEKTDKDSILFSSYKQGQPRQFPVIAASFSNTDKDTKFHELLLLLSKGDSVTYKYPIEKLPADQKSNPALKGATEMIYTMKVTKVMTKEEVKKQIAEDKKKFEDYKKLRVQIGKDDSAKIVKFLADNKIKASFDKQGFWYTITKPGKGDNAGWGHYAKMNLTVKLLDGTTADTFNNAEFEVGGRQPIPMWNNALSHMNEGSKATFYVPSNLAFAGQAQGKIPANSCIMLELEMVKHNDPNGPQKKIDDAAIQKYIKEHKLSNAIKTKTGLYYIITKAGEGPAPTQNTQVEMGYKGMLLDGTVFDESSKHGGTFKFPLGQGQVIAGWDEGVALLNKGSKATFIIPSYLAYGKNGNSGIPPNAVLVFDVELVNFAN